ncbi:molybdate ABC transporter substrate-binding protein [Methylobacterium brachythecii]|uniref:Molybdate ABC transporter substrate-binding protein n=1 Tax=Methylobacterium brachythecii TaxID=1176177 RepID=A0ABQ6DAW5_9HYPH|nr:molybdate ABC transporter substrate-binding protein [Methylobacterium brachythecii]
MIHAVSTRRSWLAGLLGLSLVLGSFPATTPSRAADAPVVVFAAASLKNALDEATATWGKETGKTAKISYAGSNALAKQLESGAPADIFWSADQAWMDYAQKNNTIRPDTRTDLLRNAIVLVAAKDSTVAVDLKPGVDLAKALGGGHLAMGNVDAVPAGKYGKAALTQLGAWDGVKDKVAQAENVRAALLLVARGEAPLGIVYASDAVSEPGVKVVATFPADSHPPIVYPIARTKESANEDSVALLKWLQSPAAKPFFEKQGFTVVGAAK